MRCCYVADMHAVVAGGFWFTGHVAFQPTVGALYRPHSWNANPQLCLQAMHCAMCGPLVRRHRRSNMLPARACLPHAASQPGSLARINPHYCTRLPPPPRWTPLPSAFCPAWPASRMWQRWRWRPMPAGAPPAAPAPSSVCTRSTCRRSRQPLAARRRQRDTAA